MAVKDYGTSGNDTMNATGSRGVFSLGGNDTLNLTATKWWGQIHAWAGDGNDTLNLGFQDIRPFTDSSGNYRTLSHGHHVRGEAGNDTFNFTNLSQVKGTVVGRIEDFNYSNGTGDRIQINGSTIDFNNLPSNARVVSYNGDYNDSGSYDQQWLLITTAQGRIFYALEGARVDMNGNGGANSSDQEAHFLTQNVNFNALQDVDFIDQKNYVPNGFSAGAGGRYYNDDDKNAADVNEVITGTAFVDMLAAGLNDDTVRAGDGNDRVWGGSGHDYVYGDGGADRLEGNTGNDRVYGGDGNDYAYGGHGNDRVYGNDGNDRLYGDDGVDRIYGGSGSDRGYGGNDNDYLYGQDGNDRLYGQNGNDYVRGDNGDDRLYGQNGNDRLYGRNDDDYLSGGSGNDRLYGENGEDELHGGSGHDVLRGGAGQDTARGNSGNDIFEFRTGDLIYWGDLSGSWQERSVELDLIEDFVIGQDRIDLRNFSGVDSRADLKSWKTTLDGNVYFTLKVDDTNERILVDVADNTEWNQFFVDANFMF